jgi:alpha-glucosidase (family GH31 glycosyl hydrolase)
MTWDATAFPHPAEMQNDVASRGRKMVTMVQVMLADGQVG